MSKFGGTNADQDSRIERCVIRLKAKGADKEQAIRICKASVLQADKGGRK